MFVLQFIHSVSASLYLVYPFGFRQQVRRYRTSSQHLVVWKNYFLIVKNTLSHSFL